MKSESNFAPEQLIAEIDLCLSSEATVVDAYDLLVRCRDSLRRAAPVRDYLGNIVGTELVHSRYVADTTTEIIQLRAALKTISLCRKGCPECRTRARDAMDVGAAAALQSSESRGGGCEPRS